MAGTETKQYYCEKCNRTMNATEFYVSNNLEKYPNEGKLNQCKKCITMHVDNWNPDTFLWILQEVDVPWIPDEWNKLMMKYAKDPTKVTGATIIGRYIGKMRLKQYKDYRWKDNQFLKEMADAKLEQTMKASGYDIQDIARAKERQNFELPPEQIDIPVYNDPTPLEQGHAPGPVDSDLVNAPAPDYFEQQMDFELPELDLTEEDKIYLCLKWGKSYKPEEWVALEQLYNEMMESYDIQQAGHIDTLKLICKTSLKANQLLDIGDVESSQKMVKMYETLMKSGKFTAAQNKAEKGEFIDSLSELVSVCEKEGFIPRYYIDKPMDRVDETLADLKDYTHSLVVDEQNLGNLIENAVKEMSRIENQEEDEDIEDEELTLEELDALKDQDFADFNDFVEEEEEQDDEHLLELLKESEQL